MQKHFAPFYVIFPLLADNPKMNVRENVGVASAGDTSGLREFSSDSTPSQLSVTTSRGLWVLTAVLLPLCQTDPNTTTTAHIEKAQRTGVKVAHESTGGWGCWPSVKKVRYILYIYYIISTFLHHHAISIKWSAYTNAGDKIFGFYLKSTCSKGGFCFQKVNSLPSEQQREHIWYRFSILLAF